MGACEDLRVLQMQTKVVMNSILKVGAKFS